MTRERQEWAQPLDRWTVLYYLHGNVVTVNATTFPVERDSIVFFAPGVKAGHARTGTESYHHFVTFNLPGDGPTRFALPTVVHEMSRILPDLKRSAERISDTQEPGFAFVWNLTWSVARNPAVLRAYAELYAAEEYILHKLAEKFSVEDIARHVSLSDRQLLRLFRREHGVTVQDFVRHKRVQEASRLLATTDLPIKIVGQRVGVRDTQQFNKLIRIDTGLSPTALRELSRSV